MEKEEAPKGSSINVVDRASCRTWLLQTIAMVSSRWSWMEDDQTRKMLQALQVTVTTDDAAVDSVLTNFQKS